MTHTYSNPVTYIATLTARDNLGQTNIIPATQTITVGVPPAQPDFRVVSFELGPATVLVEAAAVEVKPVVSVVNFGPAADATVRIEILDSDGTAVVLDNPGDVAQEQLLSVDSTPREAANLLFTVDDTWAEGIYAVYVKVYLNGVLQDSDVKYLSVSKKQPVPVPELSQFLLPLIALSVIAIILLSRKK